MEVGKVKRVAGPLVQATGLKASMYDLVLVGEEGLISEVIGISGNKHIIQVSDEESLESLCRHPILCWSHRRGPAADR